MNNCHNKFNRVLCKLILLATRQRLPVNSYFLSSSAVYDLRIVYNLHSLQQDIRHYCTTKRKLPVLTLYTKQPCSLCDQALNELKPLLEQVSLKKVDITAPENKVWWNAYRYDIPVFHLNGKFLMKHKADLEKLKTALEDFHMDNRSS